MNIDLMAEKAYQHIQFLSEKIGGRPAGSRVEQEAFSYLAKQLTQWGYALQSQKALFGVAPVWFIPYGLGGIYLALCSIWINILPPIALTPPLLFYLLPFITRKAIHWRKKDQLSQNIFTELPDENNSLPIFILSAHVDTAKASFFTKSFILIINYYTLFIAQRVAIALATLSLLLLFNITIPPLFILLIQYVSIIVGLWLFLYQLIDNLCNQNHYSPGANDNASGVGILLSIAEELSKQEYKDKLRNIKVGFLFTGAEETGAQGAEAFVPMLNGRQVVVLCLDMVGCGYDIMYVTKDGTFMPIKTSMLVNNFMKKVSPSLLPIEYTVKSGDFSAFCKNKIHASSIQTKGTIKQEIAYHTIYDTIDIIDKNSLKIVIHFIFQLITLLNEHANEIPLFKSEDTDNKTIHF